MGILGFLFRGRKTDEQKDATQLSPINDRGWWQIVRESFAGAWQQGVEIKRDEVISFFAVYSCVSLIAQDIGKLRMKLVQWNADHKIWTETISNSFSPVLRKPNRFQTRIKFIESWIISKLLHGNAYILKQRDSRNVVVALYVLDPTRVKPLVAEDGSVWYELSKDNLCGLTENTVVVPASEIIHDVMIALFHPLCGVSPIFAAGLAATQGLKIQNNSTRLFANGSNPGGILTAPGEIADDTAKRLKEYWEQNYTGTNVGKVAVLGDGLKYEAMTITAVDAQLLEQLKMTAEMVCSCFHVPAYMIGVGPLPAFNNIEALNQQYYSQCIQSLIESMEVALDEGLALPREFGVELDLDGLLRMDTATRYKAHTDAIGGGWMMPNEARRKENLTPVVGGDTPYMQQQNYSLAALAKRDADDPFAKPAPAPALQPTEDPPEDEAAEQAAEQEAREFIEHIRKGLTCETI